MSGVIGVHTSALDGVCDRVSGRRVDVLLGVDRLLLRDDCRELLAYDTDRNELGSYQVEREKTLSPIGAVWRGNAVEPWLDEHPFYPDWIDPERR